MICRMIFTERVLVTLRDGRHFVGMMRSFDQYGLYSSSWWFSCMFSAAFNHFTFPIMKHNHFIQFLICLGLLTGNVMLEDTYERHILDKMFADERVGLYVIRGENLVLLGEVDLQKEAVQTAMQEVPLEVLLKEKAARRQLRVSHNAKTKFILVQLSRVSSLQHSIITNLLM